MSKERMQKQKNDTLREILDKSWELIINEGMEALSIRKIASLMNFAPNNLYNYFKNKEELLQYLKKDGYQWTLDIFKDEISEFQVDSSENAGGICPLFKRLSKKLLHCALENPQKFIAMTSNIILDDKDPMDEQVTNIVAAKIEQGIATGELKKTDPILTAINIRVIIIGFIRMASADRIINQERADEMMDNLMDIIFDGIRKEKE